MDVLYIGSLVVTVASVTVAIWQTLRSHSVKERFRSLAWHLFSLQSNASGHVQESIKKLTEHHNKENIAIPQEIMYLFGQADGYNQDVSKTLVSVIQYAEPVYNLDTIKKWQELKGLDPKYEPLFRLIINHQPPRLLARIFRPTESG